MVLSLPTKEEMKSVRVKAHQKKIMIWKKQHHLTDFGVKIFIQPQSKGKSQSLISCQYNGYISRIPTIQMPLWFMMMAVFNKPSRLTHLLNKYRWKFWITTKMQMHPKAPNAITNSFKQIKICSSILISNDNKILWIHTMYNRHQWRSGTDKQFFLLLDQITGLKMCCWFRSK